MSATRRADTWSNSDDAEAAFPEVAPTTGPPRGPPVPTPVQATRLAELAEEQPEAADAPPPTEHLQPAMRISLAVGDLLAAAGRVQEG